MCGLAGAVGWGDAATLEQMTRLQAHRGPDDHGLWTGRCRDGAWVGLGSRRLSILDLSAAGHMPMLTDDERYVIAYNGEIFNYPSLRESLANDGVQLHSRTDTEVVLNLYARLGPACVDHLRGMFAFAVWDRQRDELFLARDHFGIKPLYYCQQGSRLGFASEIKSLLALPEMPRRVDVEALHQYLSFLWVPDPLTLFEGIVNLPAGHRALFRHGALKVEPYWDLTFPPAGQYPSRSPGALAEELRERFSAAVRAQLISDVPLGAFLSAGMDSSSIVAAMAERGGSNGGPTRTFTIAFSGDHRRGEIPLDDPAVAARTAHHFGCKHTEIRVEPDVVELLPKLIWHMDEPTADPAIITAYLVNREARRDVTVLLSGVGGDELYGGYRKYRAHGLAQRYQRLPAALRRRVIEPFILALPAAGRLKGVVRLAKKMARSGSLAPRDRFVMDSVYISETLKSALYARPTAERVAGLDPTRRHHDYFDRVADADFLNQMLYLDTKAFMASLNLTYNDKMSMASSVEVRVPFLDVELASWSAANIPPHLKLNGRVTKHILREAMRPWLPAEVLTQKKAGFGAPVQGWVAGDLRKMVDDLLSPARVRGRGLFRPHAVQRLVGEHRRGRQDWSMQIWQLLTLELWMQTFIDRPGLAHL